MFYLHLSKSEKVVLAQWKACQRQIFRSISFIRFFKFFRFLRVANEKLLSAFDNPFWNSFPSFFWFLCLILLHSLNSKFSFYHTLAFCCWKTWHFRRKSRLDENIFFQIPFHSFASRDFLIFHEKSSGERDARINNSSSEPTRNHRKLN